MIFRNHAYDKLNWLLLEPVVVRDFKYKAPLWWQHTIYLELNISRSVYVLFTKSLHWVFQSISFTRSVSLVDHLAGDLLELPDIPITTIPITPENCTVEENGMWFDSRKVSLFHHELGIWAILKKISVRFSIPIYSNFVVLLFKSL